MNGLLKARDCNAIGWLGPLLAICMTVGCGQPIYQSVPSTPETSSLELSAEDADTTRYNWPLAADGKLSVAKPPPMAYLTSFDSVIQTSGFESPDAGLWESEKLADDSASALRSLLSPMPFQQSWQLEIPATSLPDPQAFDMTPDGKTLGVLSKDRILLYDTTSGEKKRQLALPGDWSGSPATAFRFVPTSGEDLNGGDLLVASKEKLCLLDRGNGQRIAETKGPQDKIKKWLIADDGSFMVMLTVSGRLYAGDAEIKDFGPLQGLKAQEDIVFDDVGLSVDGIRLLVTVNHQPRTYLQEAGRIVDFVDYPETQFDSAPIICASRRDDFWALPSRVFYTRAVQGPNSNDEFGVDRTTENLLAMAPLRESGTREMIWRPSLLVPSRVSANEFGESTIAVSQRLSGKTLQWVLHDVNFVTRMNSVGRVLEMRPSRLLADRFGKHVAILDAENLRVGNWDPWRTRFWSGQTLMEPLLSRKAFDELDVIMTTLHSTEHWCAGQTSSRLLGYLIYEMAERWAQLAESESGTNQPATGEKRSRLEDFEDWMESGSRWAKCLHAEFLYHRAWRARNQKDGLSANTSYQRYERFHAQAIEELRFLANQKRPPAMSLASFVVCQLEENPSFTDVEPYCRKYVELFPRNPDLLVRLGNRFHPRVSGEYGDTTSLLLHHARLIEPASRGLLYVKALSSVLPYLDKNAGDYSAVDAQLLALGVDQSIAAGRPADGNFYNLMAFVASLQNQSDLQEKMVRYVIETQAVLPIDYRLFTGQQLYAVLGNWRAFYK